MARKDLDPSRIVEATRELMALEGPSSVSFRSVARSLGCAHTNLYNHFPDLESLLWACGDSVLSLMPEAVAIAPRAGGSPRSRLERFFGKALAFYLDHPGWFQLLWSHPFGGPRPQSNRDVGDASIQRVVEIFSHELEHGTDPEPAHAILHVVHAYLHGELAIFFAGRSIYSTRSELERNVVVRCAELASLLDEAKMPMRRRARA